MPTVLDVLQGKAEVTAFLSERLHEYRADHQWFFVDINGARGIVLKHDCAIAATVSFTYDEASKETNIYTVRNPDKLDKLGKVAIH